MIVSRRLLPNKLIKVPLRLISLEKAKSVFKEVITETK